MSKAAVVGDFQFDWNSTLFTMINMAAKVSGKPDEVVVKVPNHLRGVIEPNIKLLEEYNIPFGKTVEYTDKTDDVIDVNGVLISIVNYSRMA